MSIYLVLTYLVLGDIDSGSVLAISFIVETKCLVPKIKGEGLHSSQFVEVLVHRGLAPGRVAWQREITEEKQFIASKNLGEDEPLSVLYVVSSLLGLGWCQSNSGPI